MFAELPGNVASWSAMAVASRFGGSFQKGYPPPKKKMGVTFPELNLNDFTCFFVGFTCLYCFLLKGFPPCRFHSNNSNETATAPHQWSDSPAKWSHQPFRSLDGEGNSLAIQIAPKKIVEFNLINPAHGLDTFGHCFRTKKKMFFFENPETGFRGWWLDPTKWSSSGLTLCHGSHGNNVQVFSGATHGFSSDRKTWLLLEDASATMLSLAAGKGQVDPHLINRSFSGAYPEEGSTCFMLHRRVQFFSVGFSHVFVHVLRLDLFLLWHCLVVSIDLGQMEINSWLGNSSW